MDFGLTLLVLLMAGVALAALVKSASAADQLRRLERRLAELERRFAAALPVATAPPTPAAPRPEPEQPTTPITEEAPTTRAAPPLGSPPPSPLPSPTGTTPARQPSLEERFGTRWVVWAGGIALALGGIFLVRYTIEQGLVGPGVRVFLGALLAGALVGAGEWLRRKEQITGVAGKPTANIPSVLTAAGTLTAYATVWAAYELYGFLAPPIAFALLGAVALATLAAALLHGPWIAALGLVGAYIAPVLVSTREPNFWALYVYLAVVSAAAFALARIRLWRWLALTAVAFGFLWMLPEMDNLRNDILTAHAFHVLAGYALVAAMIVSGLFYGPPAEPGRIDWVSSTAVAVYLTAAMLMVLATLHDALALSVFTAMTVATLAVAWRAEAAAAAIPVAAACVVIVIMRWAFESDVGRLIAQPGAAGAASPQPLHSGVGLHLTLGAVYGLLFAAAGFLAQGRSTGAAAVPILWSASGVATPIAILIAVYGRIASFERSIPFAFVALALAALFAAATEQLSRRTPRPGLPTSAALHAIGAVAALALALTFAVEKGWLTIALALMVPGVAWVAEKRPLPMLRWLAAGLMILVVLRIAWEPRIVGDEVGLTPIFNWLLYGYGVPAAAFWWAGHLMRKRADDKPARMVDAGAILFTVLLVVLEIRHLLNDGDIYGAKGGLAEIATDVCAGLAMTIGLEHIRERTRSVVHDIGAQVIGLLTLLAIVFGLGFGGNPMITGESVGGPVFNLILLGYGLPAILTVVLALKVRGRRPNGYRITIGVVLLGLALFYLSLQVRRFYHGPILTIGPTSNAEQYTYSAVWLAFGVVLLALGVLLRSQPARLASAAVVALTIAKVSIDVLTADLTGLYRAAALIGLGVVLVSIGMLYQRLLFPRHAAGTMPSGAPPAE